MEIFISPTDYADINCCEQIDCSFCGHQYKLWCKKDKTEKVRAVIEEMDPKIKKIQEKNTILPFDKILLMALVEEFANLTDKNKTENNTINSDDISNNSNNSDSNSDIKTESVNNDCSFDDKKEKEYQIQIKEMGDTIKSLEQIVEKNERSKTKLIYEMEKLKQKLTECLEKNN